METYSGGHVSHTGQLFFPEDVTEQVAKGEPYAEHRNVHRTTQTEDGIFRSQNGSSSIVKLERTTSDSGSGGFVARAVLAVDPELTPRPVGMSGTIGRAPQDTVAIDRARLEQIRLQLSAILAALNRP